MTKLEKVLDMWYKQVDQYDQWESLGEDEKIEFAYKCGVESVIKQLEEENE